MIELDTNLHRIAGKSVVSRDDERYKQYRKEWEENPRTGTVAPFPLHLDIEPTAQCNLRCRFCATTYNQYHRGFMKRETWRAILDEAGENHLYSLKLTYRGEPLLHPDLMDMIQYAKKVGVMDVYLNTNATLLRGEKVEKVFIRSGWLDRISISFEGYTKEVYEKYRVGANFEKTVENIRRFAALKKRHGHPLIRIQSILVPEMVGHEREYAGFWLPYVDEVAYLDLKDERPGAARPGQSGWACPFLWQRMTITWDGKILPCVHDIHELAVLGQVPQDRIETAWHSDAMGLLRNHHVHGRAHEIPACRVCSLRDAEIRKAR